MTLHYSNKLTLISNCEKGNGEAAWSYLTTVCQSSDMMAASAAISRIIMVARPVAEGVSDMAQKTLIEAAFLEASRLGMMTPQLEKFWKPIVYAQSLHASLGLVKQQILLDRSMTPRTLDDIYSMILAHRDYARQELPERAIAAKAVTVDSTTKSSSGFKKFNKSFYPTDAERAGMCTVCGKTGHAARTCRDRNGKLKSPKEINKQKEKSKSSSEEANFAFVDEETCGFFAEVIDSPHASQRGKGFSSNNMGDGPAKRSATPVTEPSIYVPAPLSTFSEVSRRQIIHRVSNAIQDFLEEHILLRQSHFLLITLRCWGWRNPEQELRALKAFYNSLTELELRQDVRRWVFALNVSHCRPCDELYTMFGEKNADFTPFDLVRRGWLAQVQESWTQVYSASYV